MDSKVANLLAIARDVTQPSANRAAAISELKRVRARLEAAKQQQSVQEIQEPVTEAGKDAERRGLTTALEQARADKDQFRIEWAERRLKEIDAQVKQKPQMSDWEKNHRYWNPDEYEIEQTAPALLRVDASQVGSGLNFSTPPQDGAPDPFWDRVYPREREGRALAAQTVALTPRVRVIRDAEDWPDKF